MAVRDVEREVERLNRVREMPPAEATGPLRKAFGDRVNLVVAKGAKLAGELRLVDLTPDLLRAFDRLLEKGAVRDPKCWGKIAIAKALVDLEYREAGPFLNGARCVQMEAVWGKQIDTAEILRGTCLLALVACDDVARDEVMRILVDGLCDASGKVRLEAARALAQMDGDESPLLLRLKSRAGDEEPEVTGQVFDCLLALEREQGVAFVAEFLHSPRDETREEAALALGSSRLPGAVDRLRKAWSGAREETFRQAILRALSASRDETAIEFLLGLVREGVQGALEALSIHKDSPEIWKRVMETSGRAARIDG